MFWIWGPGQTSLLPPPPISPSGTYPQNLALKMKATTTSPKTLVSTCESTQRYKQGRIKVASQPGSYQGR
jgi:hypothetical protein